MAKKEKTTFDWKDLIKIIITLTVGFFHAAMELVWSFAGFFLLAGLMIYFKSSTSTIETLINIVKIIQNYWGYFFAIFWAYYSYIAYEKMKYK